MNPTDVVAKALKKSQQVVVLTGAGISAESGIPTFRGEEGYWTVGSTVYRPMEMATQEAYSAMPEEVWRWYLHRRKVCRGVGPNAAHRALANLEEGLGDRFTLVTQNVDGLHIQAGNSLQRTYQIHGNIDYMRCAAACSNRIVPIPVPFSGDASFIDSLRCEQCHRPARPHILWFDECYSETLYRFESSIRAAQEAALLVIIGTSAQTNLPNQMVSLCARGGAAIIDINIEDNAFAAVAQQCGVALRGKATLHLPALVETIIAAAKS